MTNKKSLFASTLARIGFLPWARIRNGTFQVIVPEWIYDIVVFLLYPINWIVSFLPARLPHPYNKNDWPIDPDLIPSRLPETKLSLDELTTIILLRDETRLSDADNWKLFDSLDAPTTNDMIGNWRGKVVNTGGWLNLAKYTLEAPLILAGCDWGKRFFGPYQGDPLIFILWETIVFPVPAWGNVSMPEIQFRGKSGAAMTYDHQPWKDHFRLLGDGKESGKRVLLGNWVVRGKNGGWFTLEELPKMNEAMPDLLTKTAY